MSGDSRPDSPKSLTGAADWLGANRFDDAWGISWPTAIPLERVEDTPGAGLRRAVRTHRLAVQAGAPEHGSRHRAPLAGGRALNRDDLGQLAIHNHRRISATAAARRIDSATFCHGVAGLLAITPLRQRHRQRRARGLQPTLVCQPCSTISQVAARFRNLETSAAKSINPAFSMVRPASPGVVVQPPTPSRRGTVCFSFLTADGHDHTAHDSGPTDLQHDGDAAVRWTG